MPQHAPPISLAALSEKCGFPFEGQSNPSITGLCYDSRECQPGDLFFALPGSTCDGHRFVDEVQRKGASAVVVEKNVSTELPQVRVPSTFKALAVFSDAFYEGPTRRLPVLGVTGTNGKTTVTYLLEGIFNSLSKKCGVMGTVNYRFGQDVRPAPNTTPMPLDIHSFAREIVDGGGEALAMEVSSHALALGRVDRVHFSVAIFTNLTQDHLDFHQDMETYFSEKAKLFSWNENIKRVVNIDDPYGQRLINRHPDALSYGLASSAALRAENIQTSPNGNDFDLVFPSGKKERVHSNLIGSFNISNALAAVGGALSFGLTEQEILAALKNSFSAPGRLEKVEGNQPFVAAIDYAHTPDALEKALTVLKNLKPKRLISVFGAGGDRDKKKRPLMGEIGSRLSDLAIITSDNPRTEDPHQILKDVEKGVQKKDKEKILVIEDRKEAIQKAIETAKEGDIVLVAGKGHEDYQIYGKEKRPFSDKEEIRRALKQCGYQ